MTRLKRRMKRIVCESRLVRNQLCLVEGSHTRILLLGGVETRFLVPNFAQQLHGKIMDVLGTYCILLHASGKSPTLFFNQIVKTKEKGS